MKKFRLLKADEIDCRVAMVKNNGASLLLYKDARCDMNILDETVGPENWQRSHSRDNANCTVSIWDDGKQQWISKEDTGTESNTEKEKGLASDSFKRACFNWGIGRELYTTPFIWIPSGKCEIKPNGSRFTCNDRFKVSYIGYDDKRCINALQIRNSTTNNVVFEHGSIVELPERASSAQIITIEDICKRHRISPTQLYTVNGKDALKLIANRLEFYDGVGQGTDNLKGKIYVDKKHPDDPPLCIWGSNMALVTPLASLLLMSGGIVEITGEDLWFNGIHLSEPYRDESVAVGELANGGKVMRRYIQVPMTQFTSSNVHRNIAIPLGVQPRRVLSISASCENGSTIFPLPYSADGSTIATSIYSISNGNIYVSNKAQWGQYYTLHIVIEYATE